MKLKKYSYDVVKSTNDVSLRQIKLQKQQGIIIYQMVSVNLDK